MEGADGLFFVEELPGQITRRHLTSVSFRTPHVSLAIQPGRRNNPLKMPFPSTEQKGKRKKNEGWNEWNVSYVSHLLALIKSTSVTAVWLVCRLVPRSVKYQGLILQISNSADAWTWKRAFIQ